MSPGENQPRFLFCRIIYQAGQFPDLAHPAGTSARVEKALLSQRGGVSQTELINQGVISRPCTEPRHQFVSCLRRDGY